MKRALLLAASCAFVPAEYRAPITIPCGAALYVCAAGGATYLHDKTWSVTDACQNDRLFLGGFQ